MPLAPAFEGDFASSDAGTVRLVMHFQYASISRGENSIIEKLKAAGIEPDQYIQWYSLRNWDKLKPNPAAAKKSPMATPPASQTSPKVDPPLPSPQHYIISKNAPTMNNAVSDNHDQSDWEGHSDDEGSMAELTKESTNRDSVGNSHFRQISTEIPPSIDSVLSPAAPAAPAAPTTTTQGDAANEISSVNGSTKESTEQTDDRLEYVSEQLYIHTKLMIVDDRIVIIGSGKMLEYVKSGNTLDVKFVCLLFHSQP
jgi:phosphatidylserine/phosphatidylglycerophosphate/cardiolipin synthase-like enzyme